MTPFVLTLVEKLRAAGDLFGSTGFLVARDAAQEAGCRLRVTSGRKVNVKKSNRRGPMRIFDFGPQSFEIDRSAPATLTFAELPPFEDGDVVYLGGVTWSPGLWWGENMWESERVFRELSDGKTLMASTPADLPRGYRIAEVDRARGRLTIAADYAQMGLVTAREFRDLLDTGRLPSGGRSRVPRHVQQNRPRLDGRRRR